MPESIINDCGFEAVLLFEESIPALICDERLIDGDLGSEYEIYSLRGSDYDPGDAATLEKNVRVNWCGSVIVLKSSGVAEKFKNTDFVNIFGKINYAADFDALGGRFKYTGGRWVYE